MRTSTSWRLILLVAAVAVLAGCGATPSPQPVKSEQKIVIASKPFAEQFVLAHMAAEVLKAKTKLTVDISRIGMGPSELLHPAMLKGQIDVYPEYTGTAWMAVLKQPIERDKQKLYEKVKAAYAEQFKLEWLPLLGFQNTFALAVTQETAAKWQLKTISDLASHANLTLMGDATAFSREDEYPGLKKAYGIDGKAKVVDVNFYYEGLKQKQADVALVFSTDGRLKQYNLLVLVDDKQFFPPYETGFILRSELAAKYPQIREVLSLLSGKINEQTMTELNYQVEVAKRDPADVARQFLRDQKILP